MIRTILFFLLLVFSLNLSAQKNYTTDKTAKKKLLDTFRKGQRLSFNGQSEAALKELQKALKMDPTFIDAQIEWANVKNQQGKYAEAELGYEKALAIDPGYVPGVMYALAIVEFDQKKFSESAAHMEQYLATAKMSAQRKTTAEKYFRSAKIAAEAYANPVPYEPVNLGPNINSQQSEYFPTMTADGNVLIYCRFLKEPSGHQHEDFFRSFKGDDGTWQKGEPISAINTVENEGSQTISADGKLIIFTACQRRGSIGGCDLYYSEMVNGKMSPVRNMGKPINSSLLETQPSLSADGKTLYFVRAARGWEGNSDIWVSHRAANGEWGEPQNLGATINTKKQEQCPFIHPDGQTLYFMSEGHPGLGMFDVFFSRLKEDGSWGEPVNMGYPINNAKENGPISVSLDGQTAFLASDKEGGHGGMDIYSFELYEAARPLPVTYVRAIVTDGISREKLSARVDFIDLASGKTFISSMTDADGEFLITLPAGKDYALNVSKEKYLFYSENFALKDSGSVDRPFELKIELNPIPENTGIETADLSKPIILKNVFFETASAELKKESIAELERLKKLLEENPNVKIQINGHTDNVGSNEDNLTLSENRAKAVYDYLIKNKITAERLKYKGFGETMPIATNSSEEGRTENRRTEFVLF